MQRHLRGEPEKFGCLGGYKYFYVDWDLNLYRCQYWETPMCNIHEFDQSKLIRDGCTRCMIDCYRAPSVLQFVAISAGSAYYNLRQGKLFAAVKDISTTVISFLSGQSGMAASGLRKSEDECADQSLTPHSKHPIRAVSCAIILANSGHASPSERIV
jgi:hypothetical protein